MPFYFILNNVMELNTTTALIKRGCCEVEIFYLVLVFSTGSQIPGISTGTLNPV